MTTYFDGTYAARSIGARTNSAGTPVTDLTAEEDRLSHEFVTEGWVLEPNSFKVTPGAEGMEVKIGTTGSDTDYLVVEGGATGQGKYIVRLAAQRLYELDSAHGTLDRIDEVYLVVEDNAYDSNGRSVARLAYRKGTASVSPTAPGADGAWNAYLLLASIAIPAGSPTIASAVITDERPASQLLVDAGTLDGYVAADFAAAVHNHDLDYADNAHEGYVAGHPVVTTGTQGLMSSSDKAKLDGIESSAQVNPSAAAILAAIKTVDGAGSGLNADLLDGRQLSEYSTSGHGHTGTHYTEAEDDAFLAAKRNKLEGVFLRLASNSAGSFVSGLVQNAPMDTEDRDDWAGHAGASTSMQIGADAAGKYLVFGQIGFESNSSGYRQASLYSVSGAVDIAVERAPAISGDQTIVGVFAVWDAASAADEIQLKFYQNSGSSLKIMGGTTWLRVVALEH